MRSPARWPVTCSVITTACSRSTARWATKSSTIRARGAVKPRIPWRRAWWRPARSSVRPAAHSSSVRRGGACVRYRHSRWLFCGCFLTGVRFLLPQWSSLQSLPHAVQIPSPAVVVLAVASSLRLFSVPFACCFCNFVLIAYGFRSIRVPFLQLHSPRGDRRRLPLSFLQSR